MGYLKPFMINQTDIQFILDQLNFIPLFKQNGELIVAWDGTGAVYDFKGNLLATGGATPTSPQSLAAIDKVGTSYQNYTDLAGLRDPSGLWNNLAPDLRRYGEAGNIFPRMAAANYTHYLQQNTAMTPAVRPTAANLAVISTIEASASTIQNLTHGTTTVATPVGNVTVAYDTWTRLTTKETTITKYVDGHHLFVSLNQVDTVKTTTSDTMFKDATGEHLVTAGTPTAPVTTIGAVTMSGGELDGQYHHFTSSVPNTAADQTAYALAHQSYSVSKDTNASVAAEGDTLASDGTTAINIKNVVDYTPRMISRTTTTAGVTYDTWANHSAENSALPPAAQHQANEIYYGPTGEAKVLDWGVLETVANGGEGQVDTQARLAASAGQDDHFIGGLNPGVSPSNGFFVLFGQFFDHGLDFIDKSQTDSSGKNITIKIALAVDDPLYGMLGQDGQPVHEITINRASVQTIDANGTEYVNHTSPFIDQSQTYGSDVQRTLLLREWVPDTTTAAAGDFHAGMKLFDGTTLATGWTKPDGTVTHDTLPTLNELRAHVTSTGRTNLSWEDVSNLRARDAHGIVLDSNGAVAGGYTTTGEALLLDMNPRFDSEHLYNGDAAQDAKVTAALATIQAAVKVQFGSGSTFSVDPTTHKLTLVMQNPPPGAPTNTLTGANALFPFVNFADFSITLPEGALHSAVSDILLASVGDHYIAGDGRANENFGLTSVHHVFHEEHNFQVDNLIDALHKQDIATNDTTHEKLHEFQIDTGHTNAAGDFIDATGAIAWNQEKLFQGAKLIVEMEYQHAAVDQYARNVSPNIQEFVGYSPDKSPDVSLEYSQVAFRFGHSTLRETIDTIDPTNGITGKIMGYALHDAFLNPELYKGVGPAAILLGMSHQQQNEVDEFITPALNQGLLGQPLDLAAINIARGRDIGMPTLNDFREAVGLVRYTSWTDFGQNMQHPSSLVNFIAAYSFDGDLAKAQAIIGLANGSIAVGSPEAQGFTVAQAIAFLSGDAAVGGAGTLGFNLIDTWLGGLAEVHQPGGLLGETFDLVFVTQIEALMDGDRFYYLYRLAGQQFGEEVGNAQLKDIVERNTGLVHLNGNIFGYADQYVDLGAKKEVVAGEAKTTGNEHKYGDINAVDAGTRGIYSNGGLSNANDGHSVTIDGKTYIQDTRLSADNPLSADYQGGNSAYAQNGYANLDGTPNSGAESNEVIVGSKGDDLIYAQGGDDTVYGEDGNDILFGGFGIDRLYGGAGKDIIKGGDNPDLIDGGSGDDELYGESSGSDINGADQIIGGSGNDRLYGGTGIDKLSAGSGDDQVYGGQDTDPFTHGGDGNDIVDGESGGDILYGDNGDDLVIGGADQDQLFGNDGDDILRPGDPTGALTIGGDEVLGGDGTDANDKGFDLIDFSDNNVRPGGVSFDLSNQQNPATTPNGSSVQVQSYQIDGVVGSAGNDTIIGDDGTAAGAGSDASIAGDNWLIGGSGADLLTGNGGNDIIIGGSIRLDTLIGKYSSGYTHNDNNAGNTAAEQLQDARYQGASHRVDYAESIGTSSLIDTINATIAGTANDFAKHYTEMLRSEQFKDIVLGDGGTDAHTAADADIAVFTGRYADYTITAIHFNAGNSDGEIIAYKVVDNRNPNAVDINGVAIPTDGTDIVVGVEKLRFSDRDVSLVNAAPTLDLHAFDTTTGNLADNFDTAAWNNSTGVIPWTTSWAETNDTGISTGQIQIDGGGNGGSDQLRLYDTGSGASIQRTVDLSGLAGATLSFNYSESGFDTGSNNNRERVVASFSFNNGATWHTLNTLNSSTGNGGTFTGNLVTLLGAGETLGAQGILKFEAITVSGGNNNGYIAIDNVNIAATKQVADTDPFPNSTATFTEGGNAANVAINPLITDDGTLLQSAKIVLTNAKAGDRLFENGVQGDGISGSFTGSVASGVITLTLTGAASLAAYQAAIARVTFDNTSNNPDETPRVLRVTVNDGLADSNAAIATIAVVAVPDPVVADTVLSNVGLNTNFAIPDFALLANDLNPAASVSGIQNGNGIQTNGNGIGHSNGVVTIRDTGNLGGNFQYTVAANGPDPSATVTVVNQAGGNLTGSTASEIFVGDESGTAITGAGGNDTVFANGGDDSVTTGAGNDYIDGGNGSDAIGAGAGNDTIIYSVTTNGGGQTPAVTSGRDFIDGGTTALDVNGRDTGTDTFILNGSNGTETFKIMTRAEALLHNNITGLNANTEIVITRQVGTVASNVFTGLVVVAELDNIEEIKVNTLAVTANNNNGGLDGGQNGGDTIQILGTFGTSTNPTTSLNFNTITINGGAHDTVDITGLTSEHRIVFNGAATTNQVIGTLRPQDVVHLSGTQQSGDTTPPPANGNTGGDDEETTTPPPVAHGSEHEHQNEGHHGQHHHHRHHGDEHHASGSNAPGAAAEALTSNAAGPLVASENGGVLLGTVDNETLLGSDDDDQMFGNGGEDVLNGAAGNDHLDGGQGNDVVFGGADDDNLFGGSGNDMLAGDDGNDWVFGGAGSDMLTGGADNDTLVGGGDDDLFVAGVNDGDDSYFGDDFTGGTGSDTLDMSAIGADTDVDLGTGVGGHGSAHSLLSGNDALFSIENVITGAGNDTIRASNAVNVMDGGAGHDTFRFGSTAAADGDTIRGFEPGDKIDLSEIDANSGANATGDQAFTLVSGSGPAHLVIEHETRTDGEYTLVKGVTDTVPDHTFQLNIAGHHNLGENDFNL